jgi:hypothetical protein
MARYAQDVPESLDARLDGEELDVCCRDPRQGLVVFNSVLCSKQTDNAPKVSFSATLGEEPQIELALV